MYLSKSNTRLLACTSTDDTKRPVLQNLCLHGAYAEATDGHIMARDTLPSLAVEDWPGTIPEGYMDPPADMDVFVSPEQVKIAYSAVQKGRNLAPEVTSPRVMVTIDGTRSALMVYIPGADPMMVTGDNTHTWPDTAQVVPLGVDTDVILGLGAAPLAALLKVAGKDGQITFRVPAPGSGGYVNTGLLYQVHEYNMPTAQGIIMPLRISADASFAGPWDRDGGKS